MTPEKGCGYLPFPRAVLFDWDNTLINNWGTIREALNSALIDAGKAPLDLETVMEIGRQSSREIFPALFGDGVERAQKIFYAEFGARHLAGLRVLPGAVEVLDALAERGVPLAIVSNKRGETLRREVDHLGWRDRFRTIIGSLDAVADKPDPAPVKLALETLGIAAGPDVWLVGDTDIDMRASHSAGCSGILVVSPPPDPARLEGIEPVKRFEDCISLAGFVVGLGDPISIRSTG